MPARPHLQISETREDGDVRLAITGQIDVGSADELENRLRQLMPREARICVDLSRVEFIDSIGMRVLIDAARRARDEGVELVVGRELTPQVERVFKLLQADNLVPGWPGH